jgi:hypothetical protein
MKDRVGLASVCVLLCTLFYASLLWRLFQFGGGARMAGVLLGVMCLATYLLALFLAIELKLWAWHGCYAVLAVQLAAAIVLLGSALVNGSLNILVTLALILVVVACLLGLWAISRPASRSVCTVHGGAAA